MEKDSPDFGTYETHNIIILLLLRVKWTMYTLVLYVNLVCFIRVQVTLNAVHGIT